MMRRNFYTGSSDRKASKPDALSSLLKVFAKLFSKSEKKFSKRYCNYEFVVV